MLYKKLDKKWLEQHSRILVTGPQRSGTTIAAKILAADLGYTYVDEREVGVRSMTRLFEALKRDKVVIQGPCFCSQVHWIDSENTLIVMMIRNVQDIEASQERIEWKEEELELRNYFRTVGKISNVRYKVWEDFQKPAMRLPFVELEYESLKSHIMWVDKESRKQFDRRQFAVEYYDEIW